MAYDGFFLTYKNDRETKDMTGYNQDIPTFVWLKLILKTGAIPR